MITEREREKKKVFEIQFLTRLFCLGVCVCGWVGQGGAKISFESMVFWLVSGAKFYLWDKAWFYLECVRPFVLVCVSLFSLCVVGGYSCV